jgi:hypothetical protein
MNSILMRLGWGGALCVALTAAQAVDVPLFIIERSKNANVVHYDAHLTTNGVFDAKEPIKAYWVMAAEDGRREGLTLVERVKAYGFDARPAESFSGYIMTIVAYKERPISIRQEGARVWAEIAINGQPAYFDKLYIDSTEGLVLPTVNYLELHGRELKTGAPVRERITAGK